jgi:diguanylate cyclase (GGDEF)-like protein
MRTWNGTVSIEERALGHVSRVMGKLSRAAVFGIALVAVGVVGVVDYLAGSEISLSVFYLCPVAIASWYGGRRGGALIALISTLAAFAGHFAEGQFSTRPGLMIWNGFLHLGFMVVVAYLLDRLHTQVESEQELARSDALTGLFNRRAFLEHLRYRLELAAREGKPISLAYLDLDDFKRINDEGGHDEGDRVLRLVANTLMATVRRTDLVGRLGGDEFALLVTDADRAAAESLIEKVRQSLQQVFGRDQPAVKCSIGCVTFRQPMPGVEDAIRCADLLMYKVKRQGKNAVAFEVI